MSKYERSQREGLKAVVMNVNECKKINKNTRDIYFYLSLISVMTDA
jgi:hypothetical protein